MLTADAWAFQRSVNERQSLCLQQIEVTEDTDMFSQFERKLIYETAVRQLLRERAYVEVSDVRLVHRDNRLPHWLI